MSVSQKSASSGGSGESSPKRKGGEPSLSASLLLVAPLPKPARDGHDYRVLLLKRAEKSSTYQNAYVFPGGNVDPIDRDERAWSSYFPSTSTSTDLQTVKLCAIRETFEESGVLLFEPTSSPDHTRQKEVEEKWRKLDDRTKTKLREEVHSSGEEFVRIFAKELGQGVRPAVSKLTHWANWVTPLALPRRFDTHFFISILPSSSSPSASPDDTPYYKLASSDGVETSVAAWLTPSEAIRRALAHTANLSYPETTPTYAEQPRSMGNNPTNSIILHPPQFYLLAELANNHKSWRSLVDGSGNHVRPRKVRSFTPQIGKVVDEGGKLRPATLLPGDEAFVQGGGGEGKEEERGKAGVRHRTYVIPPNERTQGLTVLGVHRRGIEDGPGWEDMRAGDIGEQSASKL
ncbi:NUDIX hydrolase [Sporobolomyces salmoneus]|uniref:NUDIX hydrolase n=1 Tax=Sporobolomyces salmoneus TaxID=183962 RepID=UPI00317848F4